jgi:hypothetical protein
MFEGVRNTVKVYSFLGYMWEGITCNFTKKNMNIGIGEVLNKIDASAHGGAFSLEYVRKDGSIGKIERAQKGISKPNAVEEKSNFRYSIKENFVIHIWNHDKQESRTLKIRGLLKFNGQSINH